MSREQAEYKEFQNTTETSEQLSASIAADYIIEGTEEELKAIRILFDTLDSQFGIHDDVDSDCIPLGVFMQTLVGSSDYQGMIVSLEEENPNKLILRANLDKPVVLLCALRDAFGYLRISSDIIEQ